MLRNEHRKEGEGRAHCTKKEGKCVSVRLCVREEGTVGTPATALPTHVFPHLSSFVLCITEHSPLTVTQKHRYPSMNGGDSGPICY